ncbi:MAG: fasciclin domain-containing protein [Parvibaculum sp.]|uniref:fasciclin domain-containing protein n=1 Tax=Parvibaculum sp. TaxID=2024848 RepID=UPI0027263ABA|nr:fasciclin domain-containing protein [Parvibaculum sp.]MDO8838216.1 fasciclin domain-containing protein [Parvibaculum sp.]
MKKIGAFLSALSLLAFSAVMAAPASAADVYETLKGDPQFSLLARMIEANDLKFRYTQGTITVFAPTDAALRAQPGGVDDMLTGDNPSGKENARALLLYSIVSGRHTPETLGGKVTEATTLQRGKVRIDGTRDPIRYGGEFGANVAGAAISASNGNIIPIDALPIPVFEETTPPQAQ